MEDPNKTRQIPKIELPSEKDHFETAIKNLLKPQVLEIILLAQHNNPQIVAEMLKELDVYSDNEKTIQRIYQGVSSAVYRVDSNALPTGIVRVANTIHTKISAFSLHRHGKGLVKHLPKHFGVITPNLIHQFGKFSGNVDDLANRHFHLVSFLDGLSITESIGQMYQTWSYEMFFDYFEQVATLLDILVLRRGVYFTDLTRYNLGISKDKQGTFPVIWDWDGVVFDPQVNQHVNFEMLSNIPTTKGIAHPLPDGWADLNNEEKKYHLQIYCKRLFSSTMLAMLFDYDDRQMVNVFYTSPEISEDMVDWEEQMKKLMNQFKPANARQNDFIKSMQSWLNKNYITIEPGEYSYTTTANQLREIIMMHK